MMEFMKDPFLKISGMVMEFLNGMMAKYSKDNGEWVPKMALEYGLGLMEVIMKVIGI